MFPGAGKLLQDSLDSGTARSLEDNQKSKSDRPSSDPVEAAWNPPGGAMFLKGMMFAVTAVAATTAYFFLDLIGIKPPFSDTWLLVPVLVFGLYISLEWLVKLRVHLDRLDTTILFAILLLSSGGVLFQFTRLISPYPGEDPRVGVIIFIAIAGWSLLGLLLVPKQRRADAGGVLRR